MHIIALVYRKIRMQSVLDNVWPKFQDSKAEISPITAELGSCFEFFEKLKMASSEDRNTSS